jgi:hypothetical protein
MAISLSRTLLVDFYLGLSGDLPGMGGPGAPAS